MHEHARKYTLFFTIYEKRSCSIFLSSTFSLSLPPPLHFFFCHCVSLCLESFVGIPASDVHTTCVFVRASRLSPLTLPVNVGGNGLWEIKALSCHNERLELHRDLSPMKWEGQYRQRDRLRGERERGRKGKNNRGGGKWRSEALKHHPGGVSPFFSMKSIRRTADCHWQMLPQSSLSLSFPLCCC